MPRVTEMLRDAQTLADFSNLEPGQMEYFRNNYPDFAPSAWWDKKIDLPSRHLQKQLMRKLVETKQGREWPENQLREKLKLIQAEVETKPLHHVNQWQVTQAYLRDWWKTQFKDDVQFLLVLLNSIFDPDPGTDAARIAEQLVRIYSEGVPDADGITLAIPGPKGIRHITSGSNLREGYIPMQGAILYLYGDPWRARFCEECHKRFVAGEPKNKFCSPACNNLNRLRQKRKSWHKHKDEWRPPAKKQKLKKGKGR